MMEELPIMGGSFLNLNILPTAKRQCYTCKIRGR